MDDVAPVKAHRIMGKRSGPEVAAFGALAREPWIAICSEARR